MNSPASAAPPDLPGARRADRRDAIGLACVFLLAAAVRLVPWRRVFTSDGVVFVGGDAYYHMWRVWNAAAGAGGLPQRDAYANFPHGGEIVWAPAFDWTLAAVVRLLGLDRGAAEAMCALVPVLLGATAVALAADLARRCDSRSAGWFTGVLLALMIGSFNFTQVGFFDHHAAITLIGTAMLGGAMGVASVPPAGPRGWPVAGGLLAALALGVWSGSLLHCLVLQLALVVWALGADDPAAARLRAARLALAQAIAATALWPVAGDLRWQLFGDFTPLALSRFQPVWFGAGAVCLAASAALWRSDGLGASRLRRLAASSAVVGLGLGIAFAVIPDLRVTLTRSSEWFAGGDEFLAVIAELVPLWGNGERPDWSLPAAYLTPLFFVFPLAAVWLLWRERRPERWVLVAWSTAFFALALAQSRFLNTFSVAFAIVLGCAAAKAARACGRWCAGRPGRLAACTGAALVAGCFVLEPSVRRYRADLSPPAAGTRAEQTHLRQRAFRAAAEHLAATAPPVLDAGGTPTYSVMCAWGFGHLVRYRSNLPVVQDNFGPYVSPEGVAAAGRYFRANDEDDALAVLAETGARYVMIDYQGAGHGDDYRPRTLARRMLDRDGSGGRVGRAGQFGQRRFVRALSRHRLVFHAANFMGGVRVFEIVPGAVVAGTTLPDTPVSVTLSLRTVAGRSFDWIDRTRSDDSGRFVFRLPYATRDGDFSQVAPVGSYRLAVSGATASLDVPESAVRSAGVVAAPVWITAPPEREG